MRRAKALVVVAGLVATGLFIAGPGWSFSDGIAGASGQVDEHLRTCDPGIPYCGVDPAYCGSCHGTYDDMKQSEGSDPTPQERVDRLSFKLNGDANAGTSRGLWEYTPGQTFAVEIALSNERPFGQYNSGGFNLNASAGVLSKWTSTDPDVRITGGLFDHAGTKNPDPRYQHPDGTRYGAVKDDDERRHAGEATHTAEGAETRSWRMRWTAPMATPPRGVALVMTAMLPNGDGVDTCVHVQCNRSQGYAPQSEWDWFGFMTPRRIMCESGAYESFADCSRAVHDYILPPSPPLNTCPEGNCETTDEGENGGGSPSPSAVALSLVIFAVALLRRMRTRPPQHRY